ncbi:Uncharacterised protein [Mycobacteroides abscessus subsp. abscessus]|nr:Uncharacterised protein [Mycobacteroides abscessus subsp. abscessus]
MVASGKTIRVAPCAAASRTVAATVARFSVGSAPLVICANTIRMAPA